MTGFSCTPRNGKARCSMERLESRNYYDNRVVAKMVSPDVWLWKCPKCGFVTSTPKGERPIV